MTDSLQPPKTEGANVASMSVAKGEYQPKIEAAFNAAPSFLPPHAAKIAGIAAVVLLAVSGFIPPPFGTLVQILAFIAGFLAGVPQPVPKVLEGRRLVGPAAVPLLGTLTTLAATASEQLPEGPYRIGAQALGLLLAWLTGRAFPQVK